MKSNINIPFSRNQYFYGKLLSVNDFEAEQLYNNNKRRMINRMLHGSGVVCGLDVQQIDRKTIHIDSGIALDYNGREIILDKPVTSELSALDGWQDNTDQNLLYLCLDYDEYQTDPTVNMAGTSESYNRITETGHLYLTQEGPVWHQTVRTSYFENHTVIYKDDNVQIHMVTRRYVKKGDQTEIRLEIKNTASELLRFAIRINPVGISGEEDNSFTFLFDETDHAIPGYEGSRFVKSGSYSISEWFSTETATEEKVTLSVSRIEYLRLGDEYLKAKDPSEICTPEIILTEGEPDEAMNQAYRRDAMGIIEGENIRRALYLAEIHLIPFQGTYHITDVSSNPFDQYVYGADTEQLSDLAAKDMIRSLESRIASIEAFYHKKTGKTLKEQLPDISMSTGTAVISLGVGGKAGLKFYSEDIPHGLGTGPVTISLAQVCGAKDESPIISGSTGIFDDTDDMIHCRIASKQNPEKGTFVIGLELSKACVAHEIRIAWAAYRNNIPDITSSLERKLTISPELLYLHTGERYQFLAVSNTDEDLKLAYSVKNPSCGSISSSGLYYAPEAPGVYQVFVQSEAYPQLKASALISVQ